VGSVITVLTVDEALQHIYAVLREQANQGDITPTERDLMIDGAILLAMRVDDLARDGGVSSHSGRPEDGGPGPWSPRWRPNGPVPGLGTGGPSLHEPASG